MNKTTKVKIKDGSYMVTVRDGVLTHEGGFPSTKTIGWCEDIWTILYVNGQFPSNEMPRIINDCMIVNDVNGEVWFCKFRVNLKPSKKKLPVTPQEFKEFVKECEDTFSLPFPPTAEEFLNQYEI